MHQLKSHALPFRQPIFALMLFLASCSHDPGTDRNPASIPVSRGTSTLVLEFMSEADDKMIPVKIELPASTTPSMKAVAVMHGSGGPWDDDDTNGDGIADVCNAGQLSNQNQDWRDLLLGEGFVAAFPDSYSPRGTCENEGGYKDPPLKFLISGTFIRNRDAYGVLEVLRNLVWEDTSEPIIDSKNIFLLGFSDGGTAAISTLFKNESVPAGWVWKQTFDGETYTDEILPPVAPPGRGGYKAGVVYYPGAYHNGYYGSLCDEKGIYQTYCPVLFHLAGEDPLTENAECLIETMEQNGGGTATVYRYESTGHGFDGSDEPESTLAKTRSIEFLKAHLTN